MNKRFLLIVCLCVCAVNMVAQGLVPNTKFGKPTIEELKLERYDPEPDADALVLYDLRKVNFQESYDGIRKNIDQQVRIKVLKQEGTEYANVELLYQDSNADRDVVSKVQATAYNLENGSIVATKMKSNLIFRERIDENTMRMKLSIPQVKVGTVIEYSFHIESSDLLTISDWYAQSDIPVIYTKYDLTLPNLIKYNVELIGPEQMTSSVKEANVLLGGETVSGRQYVYEGNNLPSMKNINHVWCSNDYRTRVTAELQSINLPTFVRSYSSTWEDVARTLIGAEDFGGRITKNAPLETEMAALGLEAMTDTIEKVKAIYDLLMSKVKWDETYSLATGKKASTVLKDGIGSSADINFMLINMLKKAGITAWPVVVRHRHNGRLPFTYPSIKKLNTFVVGFNTSPDKMAFIDATSKSGYIDNLSPDLMTEKALMVHETGECEWTDLSKLCKGREVTRIDATLSADGKVTGTRDKYRLYMYSYLFKELWNSKDSADIVEDEANDIEATIKSYAVENVKEFGPNVAEKTEFEKDVQSGGNIIYVNPFVLPVWSENPFKQEKRNVPVERPFTTTEDWDVTLTLPDGYDVEELPKPLQVKTADNSITCTVRFTKEGNTVKTSYRYRVNRLIFSTDEYDVLKQVYEHIVSKCNEMIAVKKL